MRKLMKLWAVVLVTSLLAGSFLPAQSVEAAESTPTFAVDEDGNVNAAEDYDGPRIVKNPRLDRRKLFGNLLGQICGRK